MALRTLRPKGPRSTKRDSVLGGGAKATTGRRPKNRLGAILANPVGRATSYCGPVYLAVIQNILRTEQFQCVLPTQTMSAAGC